MDDSSHCSYNSVAFKSNSVHDEVFCLPKLTQNGKRESHPYDRANRGVEIRNNPVTVSRPPWQCVHRTTHRNTWRCCLGVGERH
jgi:hypothetical protein